MYYSEGVGRSSSINNSISDVAYHCMEWIHPKNIIAQLTFRTTFHYNWATICKNHSLQSLRQKWFCASIHIMKLHRKILVWIIHYYAIHLNRREIIKKKPHTTDTSTAESYSKSFLLANTDISTPKEKPCCVQNVFYRTNYFLIQTFDSHTLTWMKTHIQNTPLVGTYKESPTVAWMGK